MSEIRNVAPSLRDVTGAGTEATSGQIPYRGWLITYEPPPIPTRNCDWQFFHRDFDGPEDNRCGSAPSLEAAKAEIDAWEDDQ